MVRCEDGFMDVKEAMAGIVTEVTQRLKEEPACAAVLGDLILDVSVEGDQAGMHPETGAPLLKNATSHESIGGAGNIALVLSRLGVHASLFSIVGADLPGRQLTETQERLHFDSHVVTYRGWPTPRKQWIYQREPEGTRIIQRVDFDRPLPAEGRQRLLGEFRARYVNQGQVLIVADHGLGAVGPETGEAITLAQQAGAKVVAIPRTPIEQYRSVDALVTNPTEIRELVGLKGKGEAQPAARQYAGRHGVTVFLSQGKHGLFVCSPAHNLEQLVPTTLVQHPQKMGARDMVLAIVALGYAIGLGPLETAQLANAFANLVVRQRGNGTVFWTDLYTELNIPEPVLH
jgi:rfaE bifunctional protein kinase chain/domain